MASNNSPRTEQATRLYAWTSGQKVAVSSASAQSTAITADEITVCSTTNCYIKPGTNPTAAAAAGNLYLAAGVPFTFQFNRGELLAVIRDTADGSLYILPVT